MLLPATLLKLWTNPKGPTMVTRTPIAPITAIASSVVGRAQAAQPARRQRPPHLGRVRLHSTAIATGQATPAKLEEKKMPPSRAR